MRRFQDEVRSALMKYALVPGFLITLICILLAGIYWDRNVAARTEEEARTAGDIFTELTRDYEARAAAIAKNGISLAAAAAMGRVLAHECADGLY